MGVEGTSKGTSEEKEKVTHVIPRFGMILFMVPYFRK